MYRWGKNIYVFQLEESPQPVLSLILETRPTGGGVKPAPHVSAMRLLALLDKAKAFPLLKQQHPEAIASVDFVTFAKKPSVSDFNDYEIRIEEAFRFNAEDTVVLRLLLKNKTTASVHYRPDSFSLRVGNRIYSQSISDAAGIIPAKAETTAYFAVTGTPDGGRNELSLKNDFTVLVERLADPPQNPVKQETMLPSPRALSPEMEAAARQMLRQTIADSHNPGTRPKLSSSTSPGAKQPPATP